MLSHWAVPRSVSLPGSYDLIDAVDIKVCSVGGQYWARKHVEATLRTISVASTHGEWKIVVRQTRSGKGPHQIKGSANKRKNTKRDIVSRALAHAAASAAMPAIVVGDLNFTKDEVDEALLGAEPDCENIRHWGGEGRVVLAWILTRVLPNMLAECVHM